jgi:glycosyltransferase involved in cell wall biosynthesis
VDSLNLNPSEKRYVLITPCRDEDDYGQRTLDSVMRQTVLPALWVIVDDGSTDDTPALLAAAAEKAPWIQVIRRENRGKRAVGPGVVDTFYAGLEAVNLDDFDYLCKFDLDLEIPERYFEILIERMEAEPRLGTCSGKPYYPDPETGELISEKCGDEMSVGMTKFYRTECFRDVGGFVREVMWDGIDCHLCRMKGWIACSWDDPEIRFKHLRLMGSSQKSIWTGRMRHGYGQYFMGTGIVYMTVSALYRMTRPPVVLGGLAMWWGYVRSAIARKPRYDDLTFRKFLRAYQRDCLTSGKTAATEKLHAQARKGTSV